MKIKVKVIPNSKMNKIDIVDDVYLVRVTASPVEGKANKAVIELLAKHFKVSKSEVAIIKGLSSRIKVIDVDRIG